MAFSQNGWPVNPPRRLRLVAGTRDVRVTVADGPPGDVLMHVLAQVHARVESLELDGARGELDDWGWANRPIRGGTATSNHASGTAVDGNATRHPLGVKNTFNPKQVAEIHRILAEVDHVVRWGGDYTGRVDEMHFEIVDDPDDVARVAARLSIEEDEMSAKAERQIDELHRLYRKGNPSPGVKQTAGEMTLIIVEMLHRGRRQETALNALAAAVAADRDLDPKQFAALVDQAVAEHSPTAAEVAAAQRPFLDELVREVVPAIVGDEQADRIIEALAEKLGATTEGN
ncbi:MAG TPA: M15 family metallopeptidase [Actinophytocola sp.]|nr:M15 family metallopeptidase [Actinophytocola sp.]